MARLTWVATLAALLLLNELSPHRPSETWAFEIAGHVYTHAAILNGAYKDSKESAEQWLIQSFCAIMPDLAYELDATVQRVRVLKDNQYQWGLLGNCTTKTCVHMVAVQFYLHALTGTPAADVRAAATALIEHIDIDITRLEKDAARKQELTNRLCMRGLAIHLLGDTFAHVKLHDDKTMYELGLGHGKVRPDPHAPDYLYRRGEKTDWANWVRHLGSVLRAKDLVQIQELLPLKSDEKLSANEFECAMQEKLAEYAGGKWTPWVPKLETWAISVCNKDTSKGFVTETWEIWSPQYQTCQDVIEKGPGSDATSLKGALIALKSSLPLPDCQDVWKNYLALAYDKFNSQPKVKGWFGKMKNINPQDLGYSGCDPRQDVLADGGQRDE